MHTLVLVRHGESAWNDENRFTGWTDVGLTSRGVAEAMQCAESLRAEGHAFDVAYTSLLKRAIKSLWLILEGMDLMWIPVHKSWRLNERHYGSLQGLNKAETAVRFGAEQVKLWRRSYAIAPPPLSKSEERYAGNDSRYAALAGAEMPVTESLKDVSARMLPFWEETIAPAITAGQRVLIVAHGNSLRALVKHLDGISDEDIVELNIPTGIPLVYELADDLSPVRRFYLSDPRALEQPADTITGRPRVNTLKN